MSGAAAALPADTVVGAEVLRLVMPLERPVWLGAVEIRERVYVALRLRLASGIEGHAFGYDRGMPLFEVVRDVARRYLGTRARDREATRQRAAGPTPAPRATMVRGVSLCDISLWDAAAQAAGLPLHALLGTLRHRVELMPVIGYGMSPEVAAREGAALAARGFRSLKLMIDGRDLAFDRAVIEALAGALPAGVRFGVDAHWSWRRLADALPWCALAEAANALFLEDPVAPTDWRLALAIAGRCAVPLALGEDVIDLAALADVAEAAAILRPDAAASGGVGFAREALALARQRGKGVIPHVFSTLHQHLAFADEGVSRIEAILPELGADPIDRVLAQPLALDGGEILAPEAPGAGTRLDWPALQPFVTRKEVLTHG